MAVNPQIEGAGGVIAEADAAHNLRVSLQTQNASVGGLMALIKEDGTTTHRSPRTSEDYRLAVGICNPRFDYSFVGTSQDTGRWKHVFTTMTMTQGSGSVLCNANSTTTAATGCSLQSWAHFPVLGNGGLGLQLTCQFTRSLTPGQTFEWGTFIPTTTTAPTEGVWMEFTSAGLTGIICYNGVRTSTGIIWAMNNLVFNQNYKFSLEVFQDSVEFWNENTLLATLVTPPGTSRPHMQVALPLSFQFRNQSALTGASIAQIKVSDCQVEIEDLNLGRDYATFAAINGNMGSQGQAGGSQGSTANYSNSQVPGTGGQLSNSAHTLTLGLGGQFSVTPTDNGATLPVGTDGILMSYQVPAGGINQTPRSLVITGIRIQGMVTTALTGGPVQYTYSLAYGETAEDLATPESTSFANGTTKAPRRIPLGFERYAPVNAPVGTMSPGGAVQVTFKDPVVVNPGEWLSIVARNDDTVTTAGVICILVTFDSYWR